MGLHRREILARTLLNEEERSQATKLFWSIYVLDRRWSFGTGMPFAIQDTDIDPALPEPVSLRVLRGGLYSNTLLSRTMGRLTSLQ